jgi:hypothetical protein
MHRGQRTTNAGSIIQFAGAKLSVVDGPPSFSNYFDYRNVETIREGTTPLPQLVRVGLSRPPFLAGSQPS